MARAGAEAKALILLVTFFPQCVVSILSMTPPIMASQIALSLGLSPQIAGLYVRLVSAGAILSSTSAGNLEVKSPDVSIFEASRSRSICSAA